MDDTLPTSLFADVLASTREVPFFLGDLTGNIRMANTAFQHSFDREAAQRIQGLWSAISESAREDEAFQRSWISSLTDQQGEERVYEMRVEETRNQETGERLFPVFLFSSALGNAEGSGEGSRALYDPLTDLPNRLLAQDRLEKMLENLTRSVHDGFSLIYLDLNNFKHINDTLGHAAGDALLQAVAERLSSLVRESDTVSRWGGDEFVILLRGAGDVFSGQKKAERIIRSFSEPFSLEDGEFHIGVSLGVVLNTNPGATSRELLERADRAMYRAKDDPSTDYRLEIMRWSAATADGDAWTREVRRGLDRQEFFLEYQPIMDAPNRTVTGVEALLRWEHPSKGRLSPEEFLPLVQPPEVLRGLESWVVGEACRAVASWRERFNSGLCAHINVSVTQFLDHSFWDQAVQTFRKCGIGPYTVYMDCLKWPFFSSREQAVEISEWCGRHGLNLALDDVKINLANLNFFLDFGVIPFSMVKVDDRLAQNLFHKTLTQSLRTFQNFFSGMGIKLVVKGIETRDQFQAVQKVNCHLMQGNYFAPPMAEENMEKYLQLG